MPGDQTHGFDLVLEISEKAVEDILGTVFSEQRPDIPCALRDAYGGLLGVILGNLGPCEAPTVRVSFDRPRDIALPEEARNPVDITLTTGDLGTAGTETRMIVGVEENRDAGDMDIIILNFAERLYHASARVKALGRNLDTIDDASGVVSGVRIPPVPLMAIPVVRNSSKCTEITAATAIVVDGPQNQNALAIALTCGGGRPGNTEAFTSGFIPSGTGGALAVAFTYLCRCISERFANDPDLNLPPGSIENCRLRQRVPITDEVDLTEFTLSLEPGPPPAIGVRAKVEQEGFCYEATGTVTARIFLEIRDRKLRLRPEVAAPDVDVNVPWYCWAVAVVLIVAGIALILADIVTGGVITGVVGLLVAFILWLLTEVMGGTVEGLADAVQDALKNTVPNVEVPFVGMDLVMDRVSIDDLTVAFQVTPIGTFGVHSEGELRVPNDQAVDLDAGVVGSGLTLPGADLLWAGSDRERRLSTTGGAALARTTSVRLEEFSRYQLRKLHYVSPDTVRYDELVRQVQTDLGSPEDDGLIDRDGPDRDGPGRRVFAAVQTDGPDGRPGGVITEAPTRKVFGVRTSDGRLSAVQVVAVANGLMQLRYRTFEEPTPSVDIGGGFGFEFGGLVPDGENISFEPAKALEEALDPALIDALTKALLIERLTGEATIEPATAAAIAEAQAQSSIGIGRFGQWIDASRRKQAKTGCFHAVSTGLSPSLRYEWVLAGEQLDQATGAVSLGESITLHYNGADSGTLCVEVRFQEEEVEFAVDLEATVTDQDNNVVRTTDRLAWDPAGQVVRRHAIPSWTEYRDTFLRYWGVQLVEPAEAAEGRSGSR